MSLSPEHPRSTDLVLGGRLLLPSSAAAVLGGREGLLRDEAYLNAATVEQQIQFFYRALAHGRVEPMVQALKHPAPAIQQAAWRVLHHQPRIESLQSLLSQQLWQYADEMTLRLVLQQAQRLQSAKFTVTDLKNYSCQHLNQLDQLWSQHSQGHFGFRVQAQIWEQMGKGPQPDWHAWCDFGSKVGWYDQTSWRSWNDLNFSLAAPRGHLPRTIMFIGWGLGDFQVGCLAMSTLKERYSA